MSVLQPAQNPKSVPMGSAVNLTSLLSRFAFLIAIDLALGWFAFQAYLLEFIPLAAIMGILVVLFTTVFLIPKLYPIRWMVIGFAFMIMFVIYPIVFTVYIAFTNYGDAHLMDKKQAIGEVLKKTYLPEEGAAFAWTAFQNEADKTDVALWLVAEDGTTYFAKQGAALEQLNGDEGVVGALDEKGVPASIEGWKKLNKITVTAQFPNLENILFGPADRPVQIRAGSDKASEYQSLYQYDADLDAMINQQTGVVYNNVQGTFTNGKGDDLIPGFRATIGWKNFTDFLTNETMRGPMVSIMVWNFIFPTLSVLTTFAMGLAIALMFNDPDFPLKKMFRSFLIIPYTIPGLITILIWKGMMNPDFGIVNRILDQLVGLKIPWTTDAIWAKVAILIVNLWLGYPYFFLVCSGALQSIPTDLYEAAQVDGANGWHRFWRITLPLLLVAVGPLLIASYTFNFNNFNLIYLFIGGGPPIKGATLPAGHTDILISFVYQLAFEGSGTGVRYGLASAITIVIFFIVAIITLVQFRFTNMWEEVGENV